MSDFGVSINTDMGESGVKCSKVFFFFLKENVPKYCQFERRKKILVISNVCFVLGMRIVQADCKGRPSLRQDRSDQFI